MDDLLRELAEPYVNKVNLNTTQFGYCERCIDENWSSKDDIKLLYPYKNKKLQMVCEEHIGCLELGKELSKYINVRDKRINGLIEEGYRIKGKAPIQ